VDHYRLWQRGRVEKIVREDLRDLSRLPELSQVEMLISLIPERAGHELSVTSLREDLEVSYSTIKRWLSYLSALYYHYELKPYCKQIKRSLKKEGKLYLWDWAEVEEPGARFENLIANHLLKLVHFLTDTGKGRFELHFLKNKEKQEIDFLITQDGQPWLPIEAKLHDNVPSPNWKVFLPQLKTPRAIQVVANPGVHKLYRVADADLLIISADVLLETLI
jgi:predicted AAA+ superfamily ATPase